MDQNKALSLNWNSCLQMLDYAVKVDNSELAFNGLEFMAKLMIKSENKQPPRYLSVEEGLVVSLLATAGRTYSKKLLDASWTILKRSLRQQKVASAETYIARIHAHASLGNQHLQKAFSALYEYESFYGGTDKQAEEDLFSPFTALYPLVVACSHKGFASLDNVRFLNYIFSLGKFKFCTSSRLVFESHIYKENHVPLKSKNFPTLKYKSPPVLVSHITN